MSISEMILQKRWIRSDRIWTHPWAYRTFLAYIPLLLDTWALRKSQYWPRAKLRGLQDARLASLLHDARCISYWRDLIPALPQNLSIRDRFARLPVTRKADFASRPRPDITYAPLLSRSDPDNTSGSTGKPFHFFHDWGSSLRSFAVTERIFRATGRRVPIVYMRARARNGFTFYRHIWFFLRGYNSVKYRIDEFLELSRSLAGGFILYGYTSWIVELARHLQRIGSTTNVDRVYVAGEHLAPQDKELLEQVFGVPLFSLYASRETGFLGFECVEHRLHVCEEWALIEIVDADGVLLPNGTEGRIIVTPFDNRVMPFIRYELGDRGILSDTPCPCGRSLLTLLFKGRTSERIELEDGRTASLLDVSFMLGHYKDTIRQYQLIQKGLSEFIVRIVPGPRFSEKKDLIEALVIRLLHPRVRISWDEVGEIAEAPSGKATYFIRDMSV